MTCLMNVSVGDLETQLLIHTAKYFNSIVTRHLSPLPVLLLGDLGLLQSSQVHRLVPGGGENFRAQIQNPKWQL